MRALLRRLLEALEAPARWAEWQHVEGPEFARKLGDLEERLASLRRDGDPVVVRFDCNVCGQEAESVEFRTVEPLVQRTCRPCGHTEAA